MTSPAENSPPLDVFLLGEISLDEALRLQRRLVYDQAERSGGSLILCEHPPIVTVGRSGSRSFIALDDDELSELHLPVRWINRGGGCVLHLPGQIVAYLIVRLDSIGFDLGRYLDALHSVLIETTAEFDVAARTWPDQPGVFVNHARVGSVGIALNRGVAYHGFTLNVGTYLAPFQVLNEPGLEGWPLRQTSMEAQRQRPASPSKVREALIRKIETHLVMERRHIYTDHPLIRSKARPHAHVLSLG